MADLHVLPIRDAIPHTETRGCWCQPTLVNRDDGDAENVWVHHSADGREAREAGALSPATRH